ncbi:hypothetical protein ACFCWY_14225 [Streptomyces sp. NPDC056362]|uniref:hypothetical protein n=1 Tax=unclassified Streptomyces TaxID=2593676 RepID=UPI0035DA5EBC
MDQASGARDELDRLGRALRRQLVSLIRDLTVRVHLRRLALAEPKVAGRGEPPLHHYVADYQGNRPGGVSAAETASRASSALRAAGWDVTVSREDDDGILWTVIDADRDGTRIRVLTGEDTAAVVVRGWTPALDLSPDRRGSAPGLEPRTD